MKSVEGFQVGLALVALVVLQTPQHGARHQLDGFGAFVIFNPLGITFHKFIDPRPRRIAPLAIGGELAGGGRDDRDAVALGILARLESIAGHTQSAAGEHNVARVYRRLMQIVPGLLVGFDQSRAIAIGPLRRGHAAHECACQRDAAADKARSNAHFS